MRAHFYCMEAVEVTVRVGVEGSVGLCHERGPSRDERWVGKHDIHDIMSESRQVGTGTLVDLLRRLMVDSSNINFHLKKAINDKTVYPVILFISLVVLIRLSNFVMAGWDFTSLPGWGGTPPSSPA